jgi:hypothetical protein
MLGGAPSVHDCRITTYRSIGQVAPWNGSRTWSEGIKKSLAAPSFQKGGTFCRLRDIDATPWVTSTWPRYKDPRASLDEVHMGQFNPTLTDEPVMLEESRIRTHD